MSLDLHAADTATIDLAVDIALLDELASANPSALAGVIPNAVQRLLAAGIDGALIGASLLRHVDRARLDRLAVAEAIIEVDRASIVGMTKQ